MMNFTRSIRAIASSAILLGAIAARGADAPLEKWADPTLPVKNGLALWLDVTRQAAAAEAHGQRLADGDALKTWYDGSGHRRDVAQPSETARPRFSPGSVRFDGEDDHLLRDDDAAAPSLKTFTAVLVVAPRANPGGFRAFVSASAAGKSDFRSGFTLDMGPSKSNGIIGFDDFNVEGAGFGGAANLFEQAAVPFAQPQALVVTMGPPGAGAVKAYLHGEQTGQRPRGQADPLSTQRLVIGARSLTNDARPPFIRSFLNGDITEVLLYDRVLTDEERSKVDEYLIGKHPALAESALAMAEATHAGTAPLKRVDKPPAVQTFLPGFAARALPLELTNINNLRYREDGKLVAMAYDGNVHLLSDTDGDGLEDKAELFWDNQGKISQPIGIALTPPGYPHGRGLFVACKGKLSLIVDTDHDDKADKEIVVATGWPLSFHGVDALGVAIDPKDQSIYFGVGTTNFADPYVKDDAGVARYDLAGERGTIMRVAPDLSKREIVCTGIRFSVGLAFNRAGDLFATDQEGATWAPNGNPLDELLHIQPNRHYGFPSRHPTHLPNVIDEPSTFDYAPQHQSTCGLFFNEPVNGGPTFGPPSWRGDAFVCGSSRGKLYRTQLVKTATGYVARNHLIASMPMLLIDAALTPRGDLVLATHSGNPDWGSGPTGKGRLYQIRYSDPSIPQPIACWPAGPGEVRVSFDRPVQTGALAGISRNVSIDAGRYVGAGDRFEAIRPGYAVVKRQMRAPRDRVEVASVQVTRDGRTLVIGTSPQRRAIGYAITLPDPAPSRRPTDADEITRHPQTDLAYDLTGVMAEWKSDDGRASWSGWLPHPDLTVARAFTVASPEHELLWKLIETPGTLTLRTALDVQNMLQPAVQPGSQLDFKPAAERVTVSFEPSAGLEVRVSGQLAPDGRVTVTPASGQFTPVDVRMTTGGKNAALNVSFVTQEDARSRPMALRRFYVPWARPLVESAEEFANSAEPIPQLAGGDWMRGKKIFFGKEAACFRCHQVRGQGSDLGPDLSNLIHRDYESVMRDLHNPSGALNPDYIASTVTMNSGRVFHGIVRGAGEGSFIVRGDLEGERAPLRLSDMKKTTASPLSIMPTGIIEGIGPQKTRDLLTFLLTQPLSPAPLERKGAPPPRSRADIETVLRRSATTRPAAPGRPLKVLLVAGPKDHGPSEHDYPAWQNRWATLLGLADDVTVDRAEGWPTTAQWASADVAVFYSANPAWAADKSKALDAFLAGGGGLVFIHMAVHGHEAPEALADRIGLAWGPGARFRHGPLELTFRDADHPITRGFGASAHFIDESYWNLVGDHARVHVLADATEDGAARPLLWARHQGKGRVFVSIPGHYTWTFDDPLFRLLLLRGICWTAGEPADRLSGLATVGARVQP